MLKHKNKKKQTISIVSSVIILALLIGGGVFFWKNRTKNQVSNDNSNNPPLKNPDDSSKDKDLAEKVKNDLIERISRVKNSKSKLDPNDWNPYMVFDDRISCIVSDMGFLKQKESIFPSQVGAEDYQEIVNLINQVKQARDEWISQRNQEAEQKLANQPDLFYNVYETDFSGEVGSSPNWGFIGKQEGRKYSLIIPKNHPVFTDFSILQGSLFQYYRIAGVENIPLVPSPVDGEGLFKIVKPSDQIIIKLIEN